MNFLCFGSEYLFSFLHLHRIFLRLTSLHGAGSNVEEIHQDCVLKQVVPGFASFHAFCGSGSIFDTIDTTWLYRPVASLSLMQELFRGKSCGLNVIGKHFLFVYIKIQKPESTKYGK